MSRLLSAAFMRLKKDKIFWIGMLFMFGFGIFVQAMQYRNGRIMGEQIPIDNAFFNYAQFMGILLSVFCSLFVGTEYNDGTIRNKVIIGHTRKDIFLSNLVICIVSGVLFCLAYIVAALVVGLPLLGAFSMDGKRVLLYVLCIFVVATAYAALFNLVAMLNQNKAIVSVICVLSAFLFLFSGLYIDARLMEPAQYQEYSFDESGEIMAGELIDNPRYLSGTKREVFEFLLDFLPGASERQMVTNPELEVSHLGVMGLYALLIVVISTGAGIFFFQNKDIK